MNIKRDDFAVDGMDQERGSANFTGDIDGAPHGIFEQTGTNAVTLVLFVDGHPTEHQHRHNRRHVALQSGGHFSMLNGASRQTIEADDGLA